MRAKFVSQQMTGTALNVQREEKFSSLKDPTLKFYTVTVGGSRVAPKGERIEFVESVFLRFKAFEESSATSVRSALIDTISCTRSVAGRDDLFERRLAVPRLVTQQVFRDF